MGLNEYQKFAFDVFGGANTWLDPSNVPPTDALVALNCAFHGPREVGHRTGFGLILLPPLGGTLLNAMSAASMFNWIQTSSSSYLAFFGSKSLVATDSVILMNLDDGAFYTFYTPSALGTPRGAVFAPAGKRLYSATYNDVPSGADHGYVQEGGASAYSDKLFAPPLTNKPTLGASGAGASVTAGLHRVGYIIQTRSGFTGRISPVSSSTNLFDTTSTVTVTAGQQIDFSITLTWPAGAALVYPVMTTVDNLDRYFIIPGMSPVAVVGGVSSTVAFTIVISDADLASVGTNVTANNLLLTQNLAGVSPFDPFSVTAFGSRMVYLTNISSVSQAYASEPDNPQQITADQHVLFLPGQRKMCAQGTIGRTLYILGPNWTYSFEDTGEVPVLWPPPRLVDGLIGTPSVRGFTIDASSGSGWCAHTSGLYHFLGGIFDQLPVTRNCEPDWNRINWKGEFSDAVTQVQVIDDTDKQRVLVMAPLVVKSVVNTAGTAVTWVSGDTFPTSLLANSSSAAPAFPTITINSVVYSISSVTDSTHLVLRSTAGTQTSVASIIRPIIPTHILAFDYSSGTTWDKVRYSLWMINQYAPGAMCLVVNPNTRVPELWLGQWKANTALLTDALPLRQKNVRDDLLPYNDNAAALAIEFQYQTALLPTPDGNVYYHYAQQLRATGSGTLSRAAYGIDNTQTSAITALTLATAPGKMYTNRYPRLRSEGASYRFTMNTANEYCLLSEIEHFFQRGPSQR